MAAIQPAVARATAGLRLIPVSARGWSAEAACLEKVALNPRTPWGRVFGSFRRRGTASFPGCGDPGSSRDGTSLARGNQGFTHPLLGLERCVGRAGSHGSTADTPVLFR